MEMTLRWFGEGVDSVSLEQIRQIPGVKGVSLHYMTFLQEKNGLWSVFFR